MINGELVILTGLDTGKRFSLDGPISIGRGSDNDIYINDPLASRRHAIVEPGPSGVKVRDLDSGNGTFVGKNRIQERNLSHNDVIHLGETDIRFEDVQMHDQATSAAISMAESTGVRFVDQPAAKMEVSSPVDVFKTFIAPPLVDVEGPQAEALKSIQGRLSAVYKANQIITSEQDLNKIFSKVLEEISELLPVSNGAILLHEPSTGDLKLHYTMSRDAGEDITISSTIVRRSFDQNESLISSDASDDERFDASASIVIQNINSAMCTPLQHHGEKLGVLYVDARGTMNAFSKSDMELMVALAGPASIAIKNAQFVQQLKKSYEDTLLLLANAIELRDHYTIGHTWRVTNFAMAMGKHIGWDEEKLKECEMGGILHDIGKIAVDDAVLRKKGPLDDDEFAAIKIHPARGARMLQDVEALLPLIPYVLCHHERYDGKGYPAGLKGKEIPIEGRLVCVADAFDAMTSHRPYRKGMDTEIAIGRLLEARGTQFDPECTDALVEVFRKGEINGILQNFYGSDEKSIACPFCSTYTIIEDDAKEGDIYECEVCHRKIKLVKKNEAFLGELMPET